MLKRIPWHNHITPGLREFHFIQIHDKIIFHILLLTHKVVNNTALEYLIINYLIRFNVKGSTICTHASLDLCLL